MFQSPQVNLSESNQISAVKSFQLNHQTHYLSRWLPVPYNIPYTPDSLGGVVNRSGVGRVQDLLLAVSGQCNVNVALWDLPATVAVPVHPGRRLEASEACGVGGGGGAK